MRSSLTLSALLFLLLPSISGAQLSQTEMQEKDILAFLSGHTIGARDWGTAESYEYHGPDGLALWGEGDSLQIGVYRVKGSRVCYAYEDEAGQLSNNWFCWTFKQDRRTGEVYQWADYGDFYRLYIHAEGDQVSPLYLGE